MSIAGRLRKARKIGKLHARELDRLAGKTLGHCGLIEARPRSDVYAKTCEAYAEVLGLSLDWLIAGKGADPEPAGVLAAVSAARARAESKKAA